MDAAVPLDPRLAALAAAARDLPGLETLTAAEARARARAPYLTGRPPRPVGRVLDRAIPGPGGPIPIRLYWPEAQGPLPVMLFLHGSGFVLLDLDTHDDLCRRLCLGAGCLVVSVDYRLAPEHPFPAAPDDAASALAWAFDNAAALGGDPGRLVLCGDSAGACLAIVAALDRREAGGRMPAGQLLFYPVTDLPDAGRASYRDFASGCGLTAAAMRWFWAQYLGGAGGLAGPRAAPLRAADLSGLPPAFVQTAGWDVLRDEGEAYARRLAEAGVPVRLRRYASLNHGYLKWADEVPEAGLALAEACAWLRDLLAAEPGVGHRGGAGGR